jgi:hypothetical protein
MFTRTQNEKSISLLENTMQFGRLPQSNSRRWHSVLSEMMIGDYLVMPLNSTKMLKSEGYRMNNCCREYSGLCGSGHYLIFSLRSRSGERLATLGLARQDGCWRFDQCFGPGNSNVMDEILTYCDENGTVHQEWYPTEIYYVVHEIVRLANSEIAVGDRDNRFWGATS